MRTDPVARAMFWEVMTKPRGAVFAFASFLVLMFASSFVMLLAFGVFVEARFRPDPAPINQMWEQLAQKRQDRIRELSTVPQDEVEAMVRIAWRESRFNPKMQNPNSTSHGLFGFLRSTCQRYGPCEGDPYRQSVMAWNYVFDRYGSAQKALEFHLTPHTVNGERVYYY